MASAKLPDRSPEHSAKKRAEIEARQAAQQTLAAMPDEERIAALEVLVDKQSAELFDQEAELAFLRRVKAAAELAIADLDPSGDSGDLPRSVSDLYEVLLAE